MKNKTKKMLVFLIFWFQYDTIATSVYFSNFTKYDTKTRNAMLLIMQISNSRPMKIQTVLLVQIELSLPSFLKVFVTTVQVLGKCSGLDHSGLFFIFLHYFFSDYQNHILIINAYHQCLDKRI